MAERRPGRRRKNSRNMCSTLKFEPLNPTVARSFTGSFSGIYHSFAQNDDADSNQVPPPLAEPRRYFEVYRLNHY